MTLEEANELSEYFRLINYSDDGTLLEDEFYELERIRNKNKYAKVIDDAKSDNIYGKMTDEEYEGICDYYYDMVLRVKKGKDKKKVIRIK